jgi:signal transduction histidine kinase
MPPDRESTGVRHGSNNGRSPAEVEASDDIDRSSAPSNALWRAFEEALAQAHSAFSDATPGGKLGPFLSALRTAVHRLLHDGGDGAIELPRVASADRVVGLIRRTFIDRIHGVGEVRAREAIALLGALGELERSMPPTMTATMASSLTGSDASALGLLVETAHDMRSPLTAILFLLDMLRSGRTGPVTSAQARQLGIAYGAAFGLSQMVSDLIDHARGTQRLIEARPVSFSVNELLNSVRDILAPVSEERGLELHIVPLPDHARTGFPIALRRILLNLATNAMKFTPSGAVTVSAWGLDDNRVQFAVADTGPGIPLGVRAQLFRPFRSASMPGRSTLSSSGLGLSICNALVAALGSELRASSEEGEGTTFFFELDLPIARHE